MGKQVILVDLDTIHNILSRLDQLQLSVNELKGNGIDLTIGYIKEEDARNLLNKGRTWFHTQKKVGKLTPIKVGRTVYFKREEIEELFKN